MGDEEGGGGSKMFVQIPQAWRPLSKLTQNVKCTLTGALSPMTRHLLYVFFFCLYKKALARLSSIERELCLGL